MSQNNAPASTTTLVAKLKGECAAWQALLNVLETEEQALIDGEADLLPQLNAAKLTQMQSLSNLAQVRHDDLIAAGYRPDPAGMDAWLNQHEPLLLAHWAQLQALEKQAQATNQRIGVLIDLRLNSTRQALNVLVHAATSQGGLYDQAGMSVASRNGKPLTAA